MRIESALATLTLGMLAASSALAQRPATTVQLPTFSQFSCSTTVSVPDQGSTYLGGVSQSQSGYSEFGTPLLPLRPWRNSAIGDQRSASQARVGATIHDFDAMDKALLNQPTAQGGLPTGQMPAADRAGLSRRMAVQGDSPAISIERIRAEQQRQQEARLADAAQLFQRGASAEQLGKTGAARVYYQMAAQRASGGELKETALTRLASVSRPQSGQNPAKDGIAPPRTVVQP